MTGKAGKPPADYSGVHVHQDSVTDGATGVVINQLYTAVEPLNLRVPWCSQLPLSDDLYNVLSWRYRLAPLIGRDAELQNLHAWASSGVTEPSLRWLSGPGGVGKTRLAATLCAQLQEEGWKAGFISWGMPVVLPRSTQGICIVFDYPEEHRTKMLEWLGMLADVSSEGAPIRFLVLSRRDLDDWRDDLILAHAWHLCGGKQLLPLGPLDPEACVALAIEVSQQYAKICGREAPTLDASSICAWRDSDVSVHARPLFVTAAAVHAVMEPGHAFGIAGREIIDALVTREVARLDALGKAQGMHSRACSRLCGLAAISDGLDATTVRLLARSELGIGLPDGPLAVEAVAALPHWEGNTLGPASPDIIAAALLQKALGSHPDPQVPLEWLWVVISRCTPTELTERLGRLCFDIDMLTLGSPTAKRPSLSQFLEAMIRTRPERAVQLASVTREAHLPMGLVRMAAAISEAMVASARHRSETEPNEFLPGLAEHLDILSCRLREAGRPSDALAVSMEAASYYRRLADGGGFLPELARSLVNLSNHLGAVGRSAEALATSNEASMRYLKLVKAEPGRFLPEFAGSMNDLSNHLRASGKPAAALRASNTATEIYRKLAEANPGHFDVNLAICLNSSAIDLYETGQPIEALARIEEGTNIWRRLADASPGRFLHRLSGSLNNLAKHLRMAGHMSDALAVAGEAVDIHRRLASISPETFLAELAGSLHGWSIQLHEAGRYDEARSAGEEATAYNRKLAQAEPERYLPELASSLNSLSVRLRWATRPAEALQAAEEAVQIRRRLAEQNPSFFEIALAESLNNLSSRLGESGKDAEALMVAEEAESYYRRLAEANPQRFLPELAMVLHNVSIHLYKAKRAGEALAHLEEAADCFRKIAKKFPTRYASYLGEALRKLATLNQEQGNDIAAQQALAEAEEVDPSDGP